MTPTTLAAIHTLAALTIGAIGAFVIRISYKEP